MNAERQMKIAALTWYDFDAMPAEDIGAIIKECLDAVAEEQAKRELACEALGPFAEWAVLSNKWADDTCISGWELKAGNFRAAREALAQCQADANPLEDLKDRLRECRDRLHIHIGETDHHHGYCDCLDHRCVRHIDAALGEEAEDANS